MSLRSYESYPSHLDIEADVCIIGSGAGGSAAACAAAELGKSVVVIEAGRAWKPSQFRPRTPWAFKHLYDGRGTRSTQGNTIMPLPGGRGVGGSTLINSAICFRTPPSVLAQWRDDHGCSLFTDAWMGACFDRIWRTIGVSVSPPEVMGMNSIIFKQGAEALGLKGAWMDRSAPGCGGCALCQQGCPSGGKLSIDKTFLAEAQATGNCTVYADCKVETAETDGRRITRVLGRTVEPENYQEAGTFSVRARQFILSGGPVNSPRFLLRNELSAGPVGQHLYVHPTCGGFGRFPFDINPWRGAAQGYYVDNWEEGYLLQTFVALPDQVYVSLPLPPEELLAFLKDLRYLASAGVVVHDEDSVGRVTATGLQYDVGELDRSRLIAGLRGVARVFFAAGATEVITSAHGVPRIQKPGDIDTLIGDDIRPVDLGLYASHPMGTCRMGDDPARSVVGPDGRVWEWDNLHVADASVFPTSLGVNPQVTVMAVGLTVGREVAGLA